MTRVWLPDQPEILTPLGGLPEGIEADVWTGGEPRWDAALTLPEVKLHLYGKSEARAGRKMGHLTALAPDPDLALDLVLGARNALIPRVT